MKRYRKCFLGTVSRTEVEWKLRAVLTGMGEAVAVIKRPARRRHFILKEESGIEGLGDHF